ncbi:hypothetical protein PGTUg99_003038 [Puccinia graminis f. sp. tritici]|uniref:Uncharacterized protein n=1 Tax=Puccinia graminis f. sp. tritici TaxID=56615 RepID=A0A5B0QDW8_PUCGR|nr:hypothetical protein PGTUg99_003038 [Puccinia graminis f. sp. tritici]
MTRTRPGKGHKIHGSGSGRLFAGRAGPETRLGPESAYPTLPDPNPNHPKTGSDSGSRIPFLSRPDPPRDLCRVGFGHGFSARTRPTYTLTPSDTTYFFQLEERNQLR